MSSPPPGRETVTLNYWWVCGSQQVHRIMVVVLLCCLRLRGTCELWCFPAMPLTSPGGVGIPEFTASLKPRDGVGTWAFYDHKLGGQMRLAARRDAWR